MTQQANGGPTPPRLVCRFCKDFNAFDAIGCRSCGRSMLLGYLESRGGGVTPPGQVLPLCRRNYTIGRVVECDYVLPAHLAGIVNLELYQDSAFLMSALEPGLHTVDGEELVGRQRLMDKNEVRIGTDKFIYHNGTPEEGLPHIRSRLHQQAYAVLSAACTQMATAYHLNGACAVAVDIVMKITHTDRGAFFLTDMDESGELLLQQCVARESDVKSGFTSVETPFEVTQTLLKDALLNGGAMVIEDTRRGKDQKDQTESAQQLNLKSVVCLPIIFSEQGTYNIEDCLGLIYADSFLPMQAIGPEVIPVLTMLSNFLASAIMNWQEGD